MDLYQVCSNYALGPKNSLGKNIEKIFLSEAIRPRTLIFSMCHHLVDLYHVCSRYIPGAKNGLPQGYMFY